MEHPGTKPNCYNLKLFLQNLLSFPSNLFYNNLTTGLWIDIGLYSYNLGILGNFLFRGINLPVKCSLILD